MRLGKADQSIFDIAVDQEIKEIFPSWFNTLGFAIDLDISLLKPILHFGASINSIVQDEEYHRLLTTVNTSSLSIEDKRDIFKNIFNYYNKVQHWIHYDIARNLSHYFDATQHFFLKKSIESDTATYITKGNTASILEFLIETDFFKKSEKDYWKGKLVKFIKEKNNVVQRHAIYALSKFKDVSLIKNIVEYLNKDDNLVVHALVDAYRKANPNDKLAIDCFVEWAKSERGYINARYGLWEVKEKKAVKYMLACFVNDLNFLTQFVRHETIFNNRDDQIIQNLKTVWDKKICNTLEQLVVLAFSSKAWYLIAETQFIKKIALLLKEKDNNYILKLITQIKKSEQLKEHLFSVATLFPFLLERSHVEKFVYELKKMQGERFAYWTLQSFRNRENTVYEEGRKYLTEEYVEHEKKITTEYNETNDTQKIYRDFQFKLEPKRGIYDPGVFDFYLKHEEQIKQIINSDDKKRLEKLVKESIFDKFDPGKQKLTINKKEDSSTSYTTHSYIHIFGDCLRVAESLEIDISKYRQRIINYIPFAYDEHRQAIFSLIPNPTDGEINNLMKLYKEKRNDDLQRFMPESLINASEQYKIIEAIPVLKKFIDEPEFLMQYRMFALRSVANIQPDEKYFKNIFVKYKNKTDTNKLSEDANKYLIEKFSNDAAVNWRIKQIKQRSFSFFEPNGVHSVGPQENELHDKHFASPITKLKHPKYKEQVLSLLNKSFAIYKKGRDYHSYAQYLWDIVEAYFYNLRETKSYTHLKDLENYIQKYSSEEGTNWFKYKLHKLRAEHMRYIGKPQNIAECIKKYNKLKSTQYLDIVASADLIEVVKKVINEDLKIWVEDEGFYKRIQEIKGQQEILIQETIKTQLENGLLKRGLRNKCDIIREHQLLDGKKIDFLISYGFTGPVLIETKRLDNQEIVNDKERREYKKKLLQYIKGTKSEIGIFFIFRINNKYELKDYIPKVKEVYKDCDNVEVIALNCIKN